MSIPEQEEQVTAEVSTGSDYLSEGAYRLPSEEYTEVQKYGGKSIQFDSKQKFYYRENLLELTFLESDKIYKDGRNDGTDIGKDSQHEIYRERRDVGNGAFSLAPGVKIIAINESDETTTTLAKGTPKGTLFYKDGILLGYHPIPEGGTPKVDESGELIYQIWKRNDPALAEDNQHRTESFTAMNERQEDRTETTPNDTASSWFQPFCSRIHSQSI